ncbi:MAG: hypothetical protein ACR2JT_05970 [Nocardioidaceae bacterium]
MVRTARKSTFAQDAGADYNPVLGIDPTTGYPESCEPQPDPCVTSDVLYNTDQQAVIDWILDHAGDEADQIRIVEI